MINKDFINMEDLPHQLVSEVRNDGFRLIPGKSLSYSAAYFTTKVAAMIAAFELATGFCFPYASLRNYVYKLKGEYAGEEASK